MMDLPTSAAEFDAFALGTCDTQDASLKNIGESTEAYLRIKVEWMAGTTRRHLGDPAAISYLVVGCCTGLMRVLRPLERAMGWIGGQYLVAARRPR